MASEILKTYYCESCGNHFDARQTDRRRGWAKCCSKKCAAIRREMVAYGTHKPWHERHGLKAKVARLQETPDDK